MKKEHTFLQREDFSDDYVTLARLSETFILLLFSLSTETDVIITNYGTLRVCHLVMKK